ncbi:MAG: VIT1/CCC1 transporter family protein [Candidatus Anstonellales archaeon]
MLNIAKKEIEKNFPYFILGFQDGLVNVFGVIMAVAVGTGNVAVTILAGLAATFAESVSMGAVAYTSTKAERALNEKKFAELNKKSRNSLKMHIKHVLKSLDMKEREANEIASIMSKNKKASLNFLISNEMKLSPEMKNPLKYGIIVLLSSFIGSFVPLISFLFFPIKMAIIYTILFCAICLFFVGVYKSRLYKTNPLKEGLELLIIGMTSAFIGFITGYMFGAK